MAETKQGQGRLTGRTELASGRVASVRAMDWREEMRKNRFNGGVLEAFRLSSRRAFGGWPPWWSDKSSGLESNPMRRTGETFEKQVASTLSTLRGALPQKEARR